MKATVRMLSILIVGVVLIGVLAVATGLAWADIKNLGTPRNVLRDAEQQVRIPLPEGPPERLAPAVPVTTSGPFEFMFTDDLGVPVRYDPCRAIEWVHNTDGMPLGGDDLVHEAFDDVAERTGLVFEYGGTTTEVASFDRSLMQQERYGDGFVPVIVGWATEEEVPELEGAVTGIAGSSAVHGAYGEQRFLTSGVMILDGEDLSTLASSSQGSAVAGAIIRHEIAHIIGLGHVVDSRELMNDSNRWLTDWGPGDLAGLAIAGNGPCQDV